MPHFNISFQISGISGDESLPCTPLDDVMVELDGLVSATFRFSVENTLGRSVLFDLSSTHTGPGADKVTISFNDTVLSLEAGDSDIVTVTIQAMQELVPTDLITVNVVGTEQV